MDQKPRPAIQPSSLHHADDAMRCTSCGVPWPCETFVVARRRVDRAVLGTKRPRPMVIYPEHT